MFISENYYRAPTEEESEIVYREEKKAYVRRFRIMLFMIIIFIVFIIFSYIKIFISAKEINSNYAQSQLKKSESSFDSYSEYENKIAEESETAQMDELINISPMLRVVAVECAGLTIFMILIWKSWNKKLLSYKNKEYVVIPALYYGSEPIRRYKRVLRLLRFRYGDGYS
ncbi:MAG: hypothetical protein ACI4I6_03700 [Hominimerdicola sp.]